MLVKNSPNEITLTVDISPLAVKHAAIGGRQRILRNETQTITNSDGKELVVTVKVATKPAPRAPKTPGQGLSGREAMTTAPHRVTD